MNLKNINSNRATTFILFFLLVLNTVCFSEAKYSLSVSLSGISTSHMTSNSYDFETSWGFRQTLDSKANSYYISGEIEAFLDLFFDSVKPKTLLSNGVSLGNGWMQRDWFGVYYATSYPWVYHENLGWSYIKEQESDQAWVYRELLGWLWAERNSFPHLYMDEREEWTYLDLKQPRTTLYDYRYGEWFDPEKTYSIEAEAFPSMEELSRELEFITGGKRSSFRHYLRIIILLPVGYRTAQEPVKILNLKQHRMCFSLPNLHPS